MTVTVKLMGMVRWDIHYLLYVLCRPDLHATENQLWQCQLTISCEQYFSIFISNVNLTQAGQIAPKFDVVTAMATLQSAGYVQDALCVIMHVTITLA